MITTRSRKILENLGENIKLARLRRKLSSAQVAERAGISRPTLSAIEKGTPGVSIGLYVQVLFVLGLADDFLKVANDDVLGRKLQDIGLITKKRAPKKINKENYVSTK
jgi:transcriptional regulator with XRE-family HTH domain